MNARECQQKIDEERARYLPAPLRLPAAMHPVDTTSITLGMSDLHGPVQFPLRVRLATVEPAERVELHLCRVVAPGGAIPGLSSSRHRHPGIQRKGQRLGADHFDVIVIGTGPGGASLAHRLAPTGKRILLLERGDYLPRSEKNWSSQAVFVDAVYQAEETWTNASGDTFRPALHYYVGGNSKVYGGALFRLRE